MRPSSADTSEPAWEKRKMLSMNSSVSAPVWSRKYSPMVSAESATRRRAPGGSFIWPNTITVWSMTRLPVSPILASCISSQRSLPSRVRSPTPAEQVDDLDARIEQLGLRRQVLEVGRLVVDGAPVLDLDRPQAVDRLADQV